MPGVGSSAWSRQGHRTENCITCRERGASGTLTGTAVSPPGAPTVSYACLLWYKVPVDFSRHNAEVAALWERYSQGTNDRVPITFAIDEQYRLPLHGCGFREYYHSAALPGGGMSLRASTVVRTGVLC